MKKPLSRALALLFAAILAFSCILPCTAAFIDDDIALLAESGDGESVGSENPENPDQPESPAAEPKLEVTSESLSVFVGKKLQLTATVTGVDAQPKIEWYTMDGNIASVDQNGLVSTKKTGRVEIVAKATVNGKELSDGFIVNVVTRSNPVKNLLEKKQVLSYKYSYTDDYYYTNDKNCWQHNFGFAKFYDIVAPYVLLEYDYVRVYFTYDNKDWMIQMWKGQYGLLFFGSEMGIYRKDSSDKAPGLFTFYGCPNEDEWIKMEMTLYHDEAGNGNYVRQLTRDYGDYWWCTGFKPGHLRREEPARELRMTGRLTLKNQEMTDLFIEGLKKCGFKQTENAEKIGLDQFHVDGTDIRLCWQNISDAENTMPIKITAGAMIAVSILSFFLLIMVMFGMFAMLAFIFFI